MKRAAVDCSLSGPRQPRKVGPTKRAQDRLDIRASVAGGFGCLQFGKPLRGWWRCRG